MLAKLCSEKELIEHLALAQNVFSFTCLKFNPPFQQETSAVVP